MARQEVGHQSLARVDGGLAGVVQQNDSHCKQQHPDGLGGHLRVQALSDVEQDERKDEDDGEGEYEGTSPAVSAVASVRQFAKARHRKQGEKRSDAENDGHVGLRETNLDTVIQQRDNVS